MKLGALLLAIRPKTLSAGISPVVIGGVLAYKYGVFSLYPFLAAMAGALCIQIATNLANDYYDFKKGADTEKRKGPKRVTQSGLMSPNTVKKLFIFFFVLAFACGLYLTSVAGLPILILAIVSIICGLLYTAGPFPLAYIGLGDIFVLIFFGPVAVAGTYYVQSLELSYLAILYGFGPGLVSEAILLVNNIRDVDEDEVANKKTLVVRFGEAWGRQTYILSLILAAFLPLAIYFYTEQNYYSILTVFMLIFVIPILPKITTARGEDLNPVLAKTGALLVIYTILLSLGIYLTPY